LGAEVPTRQIFIDLRFLECAKGWAQKSFPEMNKKGISMASTETTPTGPSTVPPRAAERFAALTQAVQAPQRKMERMANSLGKPLAVSEYFGSNTFGLGQMREKLPREAYQSLMRTLDQGKKLQRETAEAIALAVKEWAVSKGATHFTHWFQPMTG